MKRIIAGSVASLVLAFGVTACGGSETQAQPEQVTVTATPTPEVETPSVEPTVPEQSMDEMFVQVIQDNTDAFDADSPETIVGLAQEMCSAWERNVAVKDVLQVFLDTNVAPEEAGFFMGAGTEAYCPEYSDSLTGSTT